MPGLHYYRIYVREAQLFLSAAIFLLRAQRLFSAKILSPRMRTDNNFHERERDENLAGTEINY